MIYALALVASLIAGFDQPTVKVQDIVVGKGISLSKGDVATVLYRGTFLNGDVFDDNSQRAPFAFQVGLGQVIKGWDQSILGMKVGGKRSMEIPPELAYGDKDNGPIPANSTLKFEVELLRIDREKDKPLVKIDILREGTGQGVVDTDQVALNYKVSFLNGVTLDESKGEPFTMRIADNKTVKGFQDGVRGMRIGEKRRVVVPYKLAYGAKGYLEVGLPAYSTLVFELELLTITPLP